MEQRRIRVLVVEDGDEYITNFTTFVAEGIDYRQAKSGGRAVEMIAEEEAKAAEDAAEAGRKYINIASDVLFGDNG